MNKLIKVYGERNTNTNYMSKLIQLNLDARELPGMVPARVLKLQEALPGNELVRDIYFQLTYGKNLGWKHTRSKTSEQLKKYKLFRQDVSVITITKNPYSWLLSLYRKPCHQYYQDKPTFEDFLQREWRTIGRDNVSERLESPIELWNVKNRSYLQLDCQQALNITTEQIFAAPDAIIQRLCDQFAIQRKTEQFVDYVQSAKERGKDSRYYRDYYLNEYWRQDLSSEAIDIINASIDQNLMNHFGYQVLTP